MKKNYTILSIETSLDDTCAAVTTNDSVISNIVSSQTEYHEEFGGTVPDIAKRLHKKFLNPTIEKALKQSRKTINEIDAIAVTQGPGLAPSLEQGIAKAKELSKQWNKPLIAVNHLEAHLLSSFAKNSKGNGPFTNKKPHYPILGLIISGGHTQLVLMKGIGKYKLLGATLDDAAGEAYDKVARMLKLGYPGGPILSEIAKQGKPIYKLPVPMQSRKDLNFSFSGLKTAALYKLKRLSPKLTNQFCSDFAASFQQSAMKHIMKRFENAIKIHKPQTILLGGGVISNIELRKQARKVARKHNIQIYIPYSNKLFTDNAAMIGITAWYKAKRKEFVKNTNRLDRLPNLQFKK